MSSSFTKTVALINDNGFKLRVQAAMIEKALIIASGDQGGPDDPVKKVMRLALAMAVLADAPSRVDPFLRLVANDDAVSGAADPAAVTDAQIRGMVAGMWEAVAVAIPNLAR
jgi:hypothetical protein